MATKITVNGYDALGLGVTQSGTISQPYLVQNYNISGTDSYSGSAPDLSTDLAIGYLDPIAYVTVTGNTFSGNGLFALAVVNGYADGTSSTNINFSNNTFNASNMRSGAALYYEASSGSINNNTFHTNLFGSAATAVFLAHSTLDPNPGTITLQGNDFSSWRGTDIGTLDAAYTFVNGGSGVTFTDTTTTDHRDIQTINGWRTGDSISLTPNRETALAAVQHGSGEVDIYLSNNDEIVVRGTNVSASTLASMVHAPATDQSVLNGSGTALASNTFVLLGNGDHVDLGNTSHDTLAFGLTSPLTAGVEDVYHFAATDLIELSAADFGSSVSNVLSSVTYDNNNATITDPLTSNQIVLHDVGSLQPGNIRLF
ncbi:MAG: hypothetical protein JOZ84_03765 [Methylobacteriaceae bacterium]|nr:hypothetical protein [Methylobacteriaceae bacterium]